MSKNIRDALQKRAGDFGIVMEDTAITHLSFSREYTAAVEAKQVSRFDSRSLVLFLTADVSRGLRIATYLAPKFLSAPNPYP